MPRLEWLEFLASRDLKFRRAIEDTVVRVKQPKPSRESTEIQRSRAVERETLPNYIDPNTGLPYDPFRENAKRGRKLYLLRMLRSVLP